MVCGVCVCGVWCVWCVVCVVCGDDMRQAMITIQSKCENRRYSVSCLSGLYDGEVVHHAIAGPHLGTKT